jgi:hypothetical protein
MTSKRFLKLLTGAALLSASAIALAANHCCGDLAACCLEMLACCL